MNPAFQMIGEQFVAAYYKGFDDKNSRKNLKMFYHPSALLTFEGTQFLGADSIIDKLMSLQSNIQRVITCADYHPTMDGGVLAFIIGQMQTDCENDKPLPFTHVFILRPENDNFFIFNEMFRLSLHNF